VIEHWSVRDDLGQAQLELIGARGQAVRTTA
jgi:hypothetical protein